MDGIFRRDTSLIGDLLATLSESLRKFEGMVNATKRRDLRRVMVLIGSLDERAAQRILESEGV